MPVIGDAKTHSWMPSIGQIIHAAPRALVAVLATFSGLSNTSRAAPAGQHGGGLTSEANDNFDQRWLRPMKACLNEHWVPQFDPDPAAIECILRTAKLREYPLNKEVLSRTAFHHEIPSKDAVSPDDALTPDAAKKVLRTVKAVVRESEGFKQALDEAELQLFFHSDLQSQSDLLSATTQYSAADLFQLLEDGSGADTFKDTLCDSSLSFRLHEMIKHAGNLVDRLKPELRATVADRDRFQLWLDTHFTSKQDEVMNDRQLHSLLLLLAEHVNTKRTAVVNG